MSKRLKRICRGNGWATELGWGDTRDRKLRRMTSSIDKPHRGVPSATTNGRTTTTTTSRALDFSVKISARTDDEIDRRTDSFSGRMIPVHRTEITVFVPGALTPTLVARSYTLLPSTTADDIYVRIPRDGFRLAFDPINATAKKTQITATQFAPDPRDSIEDNPSYYPSYTTCCSCKRRVLRSHYLRAHRYWLLFLRSTRFGLIRKLVRSAVRSAVRGDQRGRSNVFTGAVTHLRNG